MDASGQALSNSPYTITPLNQTTLKGLAKVVIPQEDLADLSDQYLTYSVTAVKDGEDVILYGDSRFGAKGTIELVGSALPIFKDERVYKTFTAEIDLKGHPIYHSPAIPATFYEAEKTASFDFDVSLKGFTGSVWLEGTEESTIRVEAWKGADYLSSYTFEDFTGTWSVPNQLVGNYKYFRISYTTPRANGVGASFSIKLDNNSYQVTVRSGGTGYAVGSQIKVLGSVLGGVDGINDLTLTITAIDGVSANYPSSYSVSSISSVSVSGVAAAGSATYIATGTNITGTVDKITVS